MNSPGNLEFLLAENAKLKSVLASLIPWVGELADGPSWATPEAKRRNREMCAQALADAWACFPDGYDNATDQAFLLPQTVAALN